jgi:hypothetical protein
MGNRPEGLVRKKEEEEDINTDVGIRFLRNVGNHLPDYR